MYETMRPKKLNPFQRTELAQPSLASLPAVERKKRKSEEEEDEEGDEKREKVKKKSVSRREEV